MIKRLIFLILTVCCCVGCDQVTKAAAKDYLAPATSISYIGDVFRLQYVENAGAFLGLGATLPGEVGFWLLLIPAAIVLLAVFILALASTRIRLAALTALSLILGGGLSNLIDHLCNDGVVVDFMNLGLAYIRTGFFDFADVAIVVGLVLLLLFAFRNELSVIEPAK